MMWCTGSEVTSPFIDPSVVGERADDLPLYKRVFHHDIDNLFFIGFMQSTGSAIPIVEQQSKLLAEHLTGVYALPGRRARRSDTQRARRKAAARYGANKRPAMRVDFDRFMWELRRERARGRKRALRRGGPGAAAPPSREPDVAVAA